MKAKPKQIKPAPRVRMHTTRNGKVFFTGEIAPGVTLALLPVRSQQRGGGTEFSVHVFRKRTASPAKARARRRR